MMQFGKDPAGTFKNMAGDSNKLKSPPDPECTLFINNGDNGLTRRLMFSSEEVVGASEDPKMTSKQPTIQSVPDDSDSSRPTAEVAKQLSPQVVNTRLKAENATGFEDACPEHRLNPEQQVVYDADDKENTALPSTAGPPDNTQEDNDTSCQTSLQDFNVTASKHCNTEDIDSEAMRKAMDEGRVNVVFPGTVTQEGCCRFVSEILKCILYQRQQLPMTYDQLVYSQKKQQASMQDKDIVSRRPGKAADMEKRKCQQTLQDLEEVLQQLEVLFSLSRVPRVLLLMGGSLILPKELYEINMEALVLTGGDQRLPVSSCLRQLFRTLFVADLLSDSRPIRLMPTTVLALAHRDCGVGWFHPKLQFKMPTRVKHQIIALSTDPSIFKEPRAQQSDWLDYVWFQAPMAIKGFGK
ncbi:MAD2L1-binding protein [Clinocottus analis]|uniref:MAD2L1-binding protein n=1 Tax=Clinocottus analis TaxID=304258 RepID=UPI0035C22981